MADIFLAKIEPDHQSHTFAPPFGILYLASALENEGFKVRLYHERGTPENIRALSDEVLKTLPLCVGISTFTGPSILPSLVFSRTIKESSPIPVVWGGLHATMLPEQTLRNRNIDFVVLGEGEETLAELANALAGGGFGAGAWKSIQGLGYKEDGRIRINPPRPFISELDRYGPAWHHLDRERYIYRDRFFYSLIGSRVPGDRIASLITSRGCPWRCGYCYNQFVNKSSFRAHSVQRVVQDIESLEKKHRATAVVFEDDCFFADKKRALAILRNVHIPWSSSIRANYLAQWGEPFIQELASDNCFELRVGAESGSQRILDIMNKGIQVKDIYRSAELCLKHNLNLLLGFMIGIPGESWEDMLQTFKLMDDLEKMGVTVASGPALFFPYPGTPLYDRAVEKGFVPPGRLEDWAAQWGPKQPAIPYVDKRTRYVGYYRTLALRRDLGGLKFPLFARILKSMARKRWEKRAFRFPVDYHLPRFILKSCQALRLKNLARAIYD
jgi:radical SAM superfamily enzyme YgiQ (UPF0313 family)